MNYDFDRELAMKTWEEVYGDLELAEDFSGRKIKREDYKNENSQYSWEISNMFPHLNKSKLNPKNFVILHSLTRKEKADNGTFKSNNRLFQIRKSNDPANDLGYDLFELTDEDQNQE